MSPAAVSAREAPESPAGTITEVEFALLRDLIHRSSGIFLGDNRRALLVSRLAKRLRDLDLDSFAAYYEYLIAGHDPTETRRMLECIVTNETRFFRESGHFEFLEDTVYPEWEGARRSGARGRRIRAWSAACSTGEEVYSLAMSLLWNLPEEEGWDIRVLGTDLSRSVLQVALTGVWSSEQARHIPHHYLVRFMRRGTRGEEGRMSAAAEIRSAARFGEVNLHDGDSYPARGAFDLILCRNVLIYFDPEARRETLSRLAERLAPGGYLLLGHAERPDRALDHLQRVSATVYRAPTVDSRRRPE